MHTKDAVRGLAVLALPVLLASCAAHSASFRPTDATTYTKGYRATVYEVRLDTQRLGIVKVYSAGGGAAPAGGPQPVIDVGLRIRNLSDGPMSLDLSKCDIEIDSDSGRQVIAKPTGSVGMEPIPPGGIGQIVLFYPLQDGVQPDQVNSFDFDWTIDTGKGVYANTTPFVRRVVQDEYVYYPLYGGWWGYPPLGWGWDGGGWAAWGGGDRGRDGRGGGEWRGGQWGGGDHGGHTRGGGGGRHGH
jgi:hypothetical protein